MSRGGARRAATRTETDALVVRNVEYGDADAVVTLYTERLGKISALARGAKRSTKRFGGALDPMHTIRVTLDERAGSDLATLVEAHLVEARLRLSADLDKLDAAGRALRWVRAGSPPRTPEPRVWAEIGALLDRLDDPADVLSARAHLAATGLRLLAAFGWGLDFSACVRCGKSCDAGRSAYVDATVGGLVCRACGGARRRLDAGARARLAAASAGGDGVLLAEDAQRALALVDEAFAAHAGVGD